MLNKLNLFYIKRIKLVNYRNYENVMVSFSPHFNLITGFNGEGKTNLVDAIYYACMTKSNFTSRDQYVVRSNEDFFRIETLFQKNDDKETIVTKVQPGKSKVIEKDQVAYKLLSEHIGSYPIVFIAPRDIRLINEVSAVRRSFINATLSQLNHEYLKALINYNRILKQRNALLKAGRHGSQIKDMIKVYDKEMQGHAELIFKERVSMIEMLSVKLNAYQNAISNNKEEVACSYVTKMLSNDWHDLMDQSFEKDVITKRTNEGIHKDDLLIQLDGVKAKAFGSQGQIKSIVLALKLSQYDIINHQNQTKPLIILDDLFDKLDAERVGKVLNCLRDETFGQIFITDTETERSMKIITDFDAECKVYQVREGLVDLINDA